MPTTKKEVSSERNISNGKMDGRTNGSRSSFRTDTAISNNRFNVHEKVLQPWVSDSKETIDGSLEKSGSAGHWDQFAANEKLFGLKTDYDESIYTTAINKNHPQYRERIAAADKKVREIERSAAATTHVAEERVMDYMGGKGGDENEEDKYSGVRRQQQQQQPQQEFSPLSSGRENRYTPPAKRAPTGQATVKGAPVDPAIISSQIKVSKKQAAQAPEQQKPQTPQSEPSKNVTPVPKVEVSKPADVKSAELKPADAKPAQAKPAAPAQDVKPQEKQSVEQIAASSRATPVAARTTQPTMPVGAPNATSTVERDVLSSFKTFAQQQRINAEKVRANKVKVDKEGRLNELKNFANSFKLSTPVPTDLVCIIAKDPAKQKEIQAKAMKNAEEMARARSEALAKKEARENKDAQPKQPKQPEQIPAAADQDARPAAAAAAAAAAASAAPGAAAASRPAPAGPQATPSTTTGPGRHPGPRQQFGQQYHNAQGFRNNRSGAQQHAPLQHAGGHLAQRLRNVEQQKFSQPPAAHQHQMVAEVRVPPTGPANPVDTTYTRRHNGHLGAKLNPNSNEFRPSPFAATFNPNTHPSAGSSPRAATNPVIIDASSPFSNSGQLIRRKTKAVDATKCDILSHIKQATPPAGRNWDDNGGLRPSYDTPPTYRQLKDDEKADSTMRLTFREHFERNPFSGPSMPTPNPPHVVPQMPHQHQLPFHLQHGAHNLPPRQSPHMPPMQIHATQHGPMPHQPYGNDDHRMMHSNSAQSYASPRMGQLPVAYPGMNPPGQVPYNQPVFMGATNGQMAQYRAYGNTHYGPPHGQISGQPMMIQPQFIPGPHGMIAPHMMYPGAHHHQFIPPAGPPQPMPGANGYPSPGRPAAPMMAHQGSQQGQNSNANNANNNNLYAMSPSVPYNQPNFVPGQTNPPVTNARPYNGPGPQPFSTSPQTHHLYMGPNGNHHNKTHGPPGYHPGPQVNHGQGAPRLAQGRAADGSDEAK